MAEQGRYVYGIAEGANAIRFGRIGIDSSEVYTIPFEGMSAIVHACDAAPYQSTDQKTVENWVTAHQAILEEAGKQFETVIPLAFDAIVRSPDSAVDADQVVKDWLREDQERLRALIKKIRGKDEYAVQVWYTPETMAKLACAGSDDTAQLVQEVALKPPGTAYLYKQKLKQAVKTNMEELANEWFRDFYARIKLHCEDMVVERTRQSRDKVMLLNLSCLVARDRVHDLGNELEKINSTAGFSVHFSGPWPPYSFVARPVVTAGEAMK